MYYISKIAQAAGLTIILAGFIIRFPELMSYKALFSGLLMFGFGILIQSLMLQK